MIHLEMLLQCIQYNYLLLLYEEAKREEIFSFTFEDLLHKERLVSVVLIPNASLNDAIPVSPILFPVHSVVNEMIMK